MSLTKPQFEKDVVYLVQFPRATSLPNLSPFCLKLETWLRVNGIKYEHVSNEFTKMSKKGQVPYIELNGEQMADSNLIIEQLPAKLGKKNIDDGMSDKDWAQSRAIHALIEDKMMWGGFGLLGHEGRAALEGNGMIANVPMLLKPIVLWKFNRYLTNRAWYHGIGRHSKEEMVHFVKEDMKAVSTLLGEKPFFIGDKPTTLDCTAFGHLAAGLLRRSNMKEILEVQDYANKHHPNLRAFLKRMIEKYYPDWKELCPQAVDL